MSTFLRIQAGSDTLAASTTNKNITIPSAVVMANTLFIIVFRSQSNAVLANSMISYQLSSTTQGAIRREVFGPNVMEFDWYAIEWSAGVTVKRGSVVMNLTPNNGTLSPTVDSNKSFPIISCRTGQTVGIFLEHVMTRAYFPNYPSLIESQIRFDTLTTTGFQIIEWQVVEIDDAEVEQFLGTSSAASSNQAVDAPDLSKQFHIMTTKATSTVDMNGYKLSQYDTANNIRIASWNTSTLDYAIHSIRIPNIRVQRGYTGFAGLSIDYTVSTLVEENTFTRHASGYGSWGVVNTTSLDVNKFAITAITDSTTNVHVERFSTDVDTVAFSTENIEFIDPSGTGYPWLDRAGEDVGGHIGTEFS